MPRRNKKQDLKDVQSHCDELIKFFEQREDQELINEFQQGLLKFLQDREAARRQIIKDIRTLARRLDMTREEVIALVTAE